MGVVKSRGRMVIHAAVIFILVAGISFFSVGGGLMGAKLCIAADDTALRQGLSVTGGVGRRHIDISSPHSGGYLYEDFTIVGSAEISESFTMSNIPPGGRAQFFDFGAGSPPPPGGRNGDPVLPGQAAAADPGPQPAPADQLNAEGSHVPDPADEKYTGAVMGAAITVDSPAGKSGGDQEGSSFKMGHFDIPGWEELF